MRNFLITSCLVLFAGVTGAYAQRGEVGVAVGGSLYRNQTLTNNGQTAQTGLSNGLSGSAWIGQNMYRYVGGEIRYTYERNDFKLSNGGSSVGFTGDAHVVHYDLLVHFTPRNSRVRPFVLGGGGVKLYRGTGAEAVSQPLSRFALLTHENEMKAVISAGAGVKVAVTKHVTLRAEFRDYITPFPQKIVTPNVNTSGTSLLHNFVPSVGLSYGF
jgi:opacity protein-like surface antigen